MTADVSSVGTIDVPGLDLDSGTYTLQWKDDDAGRAALLFYGHVLRRTEPARGQAILNLARAAGGIAGHDANMDDLVNRI